MAMQDKLEKLVDKILDRALETGYVTKEELIVLLMYQKQSKKPKDMVEEIISKGTKIIGAIDSIMGGL